MTERTPASLENMRSVIDWQQAGFVHPLTCGVDSGHPDLLPSVDGNGKLELVCVKCDYRQAFIPEQVLSAPRSSGWSLLRAGLFGPHEKT